MNRLFRWVKEKIMGEETRIKVVIALAVTEAGDWYAVGSKDWYEHATVEEACGQVSVGSNLQTYLIELEVSRPKPQVIRLPSPADLQLDVTGIVREVK